MKIGFINEDPNCPAIDFLIYGDLYESDLCMDSDYFYFIKGNFYPKTWFQIIEQ